MIKQRGFKNYYEELDEVLIRIAESIQFNETRKKEWNLHILLLKEY